jgi:hypothetical protein
MNFHFQPVNMNLQSQADDVKTQQFISIYSICALVHGFTGCVLEQYAGLCLLISILTDRKDKNVVKSCNGEIFFKEGNNKTRSFQRSVIGPLFFIRQPLSEFQTAYFLNACS